MSRETRGGNVLGSDGYGLGGSKDYGIMQVRKKFKKCMYAGKINRNNNCTYKRMKFKQKLLKVIIV